MNSAAALLYKNTIYLNHSKITSTGISTVGTVPAMVTVMESAAWAVIRGRAAPQAVNCSVVADWAMRSRPLLVAVTPETVKI